MIVKLLEELQPWHWFIFGICLLIFELFGTAGFFIGISVAAITMALLNLITNTISWEWQLIIFSVLAVVFTVLYLKIFRQFNLKSDSPKLNDRAAQLVGRRFTLEKAVEGQEKVQIGDTFWTVESDCNIGSGTQVRVIDTKGMTLVIEALNEDSPTDDVVA